MLRLKVSVKAFLGARATTSKLSPSICLPGERKTEKKRVREE